MKNLKIKYLGQELKSPIIVGACNLSTDASTAIKMEEAGAGAIIYKSLFEEQVLLDNLQFQLEMEEFNNRHAEMTRIFPDLDHAGPMEHIVQMKEVIKKVNIPVFASLNAVDKDRWLEWAVLLADTGVKGLELNFYHNPFDYRETSVDIEEEIIHIVSQIRFKTHLPLAVKLSPFYTNVLNIIHRLDSLGVESFVLFNHLFQPEIDIEKVEHVVPYYLSSSADNRLSLRYAGLLYGNLKGQIVSNTGIHSGKDVIRQILAGADAVQVVSALYKSGIDHIGTMLREIENWMARKGYNSIDDFKGKLSKKNIKDPYVYKRAQYVDMLMHSENILNRQPLV